ncbi:nitrite reductase (NAD(P)H) small subunit [Salibacterium salarium]|uniref:Nitrite reductase (NAD(P)H) small subunit n=1 Tax=Salibacterium salarium TaxID=284579 RepID=A0A3R9QPV7_9BACI|nr:nitrite reductase small subunit NirD [Salibacterium salarium]RSL34957.1 nitrite reductase (NAD(P)H) small subunit [Salibacterium salarium]
MDTLQGKKEIYILDYKDLRANVPREILIGDQSIAIFLTHDGDVHAIENKCPHKGGPLSQGIVSGEYVFCPLHDWKINVTDGKAQAPDEGCVTTYETVIKDGSVYIMY